MISVLPLLLWCAVHQKSTEILTPVLVGLPQSTITLADSRIDESSGLAVSILHNDVYYTQNDSGDTARIFAFDKRGQTIATIDLQGVTAIDCEDMAISKAGGRSKLYLGDIGDNSQRRSNILVYRFDEPTTLARELHAKPEILEFEYPDGPHNAESLLVHPTTGAITIVAKTDKGPSGIYTTGPNPPPGKIKLTRVGQIEISFPIKEAKLITGGSWSSDGKYVALRTYVTAYEYPAKSDKWWTAKAKTIPVPFQKQGESIAYLRDGSKVLTSSEGSPCVVDFTAVSR